MGGFRQGKGENKKSRQLLPTFFVLSLSRYISTIQEKHIYVQL